MRKYSYFPKTVAYTVGYGAAVAGVSFVSPKTAYAMALDFSRRVLRAGGIRLTIDGGENLPAGPVVVVANHQSLLDVPALFVALPYTLHFVAKRELAFIPFFGWGLWAMGHVLVNRRNREQATRSLDHAAARVRDGVTVVVFPEGTRSTSGSMLPFKKGAFVLAIKAGVPIVPVSISGSRAALAKGELFATPGEIKITVSPPIDASRLTLEQKDRLIAEAEAAVRSGYDNRFGCGA